VKKNSSFVWIGAAVLLALVFSTKSAAANTANGDLDLSSLSDAYGQDAVNRLNSIYAELLSRGYSTQQILFMLSQILHESGLFTDVANYGLMNQNNYAGLTVTSGGYASFPNISAFVDAYEGFMTKWSDPIGATSLTDFNNRLVANGYYTANPAAYLNSLQVYYNLLSQTLK
jgi:hypothetical protein